MMSSQRPDQAYAGTTDTSLHGVFMDIFDQGVLLIGASGSGKSDLALELISRGHRLIADDAPEFRRHEPDNIEGSCPLEMSGFLAVRNLGILNVRRLFGDTAVSRSSQLSLIINLQPTIEMGKDDGDCLAGARRYYCLLGVPIPQIDLAVLPGRHLALLVECAVRDLQLRIKGYYAHQDFSERLQQRMNALSCE